MTSTVDVDADDADRPPGERNDGDGAAPDPGRAEGERVSDGVGQGRDAAQPDRQDPSRASRSSPTSSATKRRSSPRSRTRSSRKHDMLFLGLRGQAKTRMLRQLVHLLDDAMPIVAGSEVNDDPYAPISKDARDQVAAQGDDTPIDWVGRDDRYHEKLATPDVTIADLIGEVDMIKHAEGRYLSSELTMHFGLIPRTNRGIFCINELPDLSPKIQVGLFNVLEERDVQIRGYPGPARPRPLHGLLGQPRGLHQPRPDRHPAEGPDRLGRPHPLPADPRARASRSATRTPGSTATAADAGGPALHQGGRRGDLAAGPVVAARQPAVGRLGPDVDRQPGERRLQRRAAGARQRRALDRARGSPTWRTSLPSSRGKLELTMTEDDGHEDKLIGRIVDEAVKNVFAQHLDVREFRPVGRLLRVGQGRRGRRHARRPRTCSTGSRRSPACASRPRSWPAKLLPDLSDADAREAADRQRRRVHPRRAPRPQQAEQDGQGRRDVVPALSVDASTDADRGSIMSLFEYTQVGRLAGVPARSRPTRPSTSSPNTCCSTATRSSATSTTSTTTRCPRSSS